MYNPAFNLHCKTSISQREMGSTGKEMAIVKTRKSRDGSEMGLKFPQLLTIKNCKVIKLYAWKQWLLDPVGLT